MAPSTNLSSDDIPELELATSNDSFSRNQILPFMIRHHQIRHHSHLSCIGILINCDRRHQCYQHHVVENIAEGSEKKISETSGKISENVGKTNISKNNGKISSALQNTIIS